MNTEQARARAETLFKRKEEQQSEALKAREEYEARQRAIGENTARLRALRLHASNGRNPSHRDDTHCPSA
jgi:hypothetical protein